MAKYRKLGRTSSQRKALLRNQVTALLNNGKIVTTEAKAKEIRKIAEGLIAMAVKEKDNFEEVTVKAKVARKDENGKRVKEVVDGKKKTVYDEVDKTIKKDMPSRLHARRQMLKVLYPVTEVPTAQAERKTQKKLILLLNYSTRSHQNTQIVKVDTQESLRLVSVKVTQLWKFSSSLYNCKYFDNLNKIILKLSCENMAAFCNFYENKMFDNLQIRYVVL